jgi:hypothetical protein
MRHGDINLTMNRYSHIFKGQESEAVKKLPDLSQPSSQTHANKKTGTDDVNITQDKNKCAIYLAKQGYKPDYNRKHQVTEKRVFEDKTKHSNTPGGIRTPNLRFRRPTLYPIELQAQKLLSINSIISC